MINEVKIKVVFNDCYGGFGLSNLAKEKLEEWGVNSSTLKDDELPRHHPLLVRVVEELESEANGRYASLKVCEIEGRRYRIDEYDGSETVMTPEDTDWIVVGYDDF